MQLIFPHIEAVIFDFDDTLVPSSAIYEAVYRRLGVANDAAFLAARQCVKDRLGKDAPASHQRLLYFKAWHEGVSDERGQQMSPSRLLGLQHAYERGVAALTRAAWQRYERARWLSRLGRRVKLGVCTNEVTRMQLCKWQAVDTPRGWCDAFVTSEEMGHEKPSVLLFLEVAKRLRVSPSRCLMVGDDVRRDIAPARALGMQTAWTSEFLSPLKLRAQRQQHAALVRATPHVRDLRALHLA